jgi:hypothetical protein
MPRRASPWPRLLSILWQAPLIALPFAGFFAVAARGTPGFAGYYIASLVFAVAITLNLWALDFFGMPRLRAAFPHWRPTLVPEALVHLVAVLGASLQAAWVIHRFLFPGFLGSLRLVVVVGLYALIFGALGTAVVLVWQYHQSTVAHERVVRDLELARQIQQSFLPATFPSHRQLDVHAVNVPSRTVSGDFYDVVPVGDALLLAVADVEGKGIPAALLTGMLQASLRTQMAEESVAVIVGNINRLVCRRSGTLQQFATFFLARVDAESRLTYCNAGHNAPLLLRANREPMALERGGIMLGVLEHAPFQEERIALQRGDLILLYTDGITERTNPRNEELGIGRLTALLGALPPELSAAGAAQRLLNEADLFADGVQPGDDQTLMVVRVRA